MNDETSDNVGKLNKEDGDVNGRVWANFKKGW